VEESTREEISARLKADHNGAESEKRDLVEPKQEWVEPVLIAYNSSDLQDGASSNSSTY
jgi:hypothetical protein